MENSTIKGVQIIVIKFDKVLLGFHTRKNCYGLPGGHIEEGETPEEAAIREAREESGVTCTNLRSVDQREFFNPQKQKMYLNYSFVGDYLEGDPRDDVNEEIQHWQWLTIEEALSTDLYPAARDLLQKISQDIKE